MAKPNQGRPKAAPPAAVAPPLRTPFERKKLADRVALPALLVLLAAALLLRLLHLDALSLWVDEFVHVLRAKSVAEGTGPLLTDDNNGILLTALMTPLFKIFGSGAWVARSLSVAFGVGTLYLMYRMGTLLMNRYVGLLAAFAGTFSLYLIFWSRIARNYAILGFFMLLVGYLFLRAFDNPPKPDGATFWERHGISRRHLYWLPVALIGALMSHQLAFFFVFTAGVFAWMVALGRMLKGSPDRFANKYLWLALGISPLLLMALPGLNQVLRGPLSLLLSDAQLNWILPQWSRLAELWAEQPLTAFQVYHGVLRYDPTLLYFPAAGGLIAAFVLRPHTGAWLLGAVVAPLLLMGFLYREPALPRYFIFVFPYFLLSAAVFFYGVYDYISGKKWPHLPAAAHYGLLLLPVLFILGSVRWPELKSVVLAERQEGHVVDNNICEFNFTNWRQPAAFVQKKKKEGDLILSTVTTAAGYYLDEDAVIQFRQNHYDTEQKKYVSNASIPDRPSAATLEDLQRTVQQYPRGWLLADYYMDNIMVDDRARMFVYRYMTFYPEASPDGSVMVFGWDRDKPLPQHQNMVVQLGKAADKIQSANFFITVPPEEFYEDQMELIVRRQGVNSNREGLVVLNDENAVYLPPNRGRMPEIDTLVIQKAWLRPGPNKLQFLYEEKVKSDPDKGFTVYFLGVD